MKRERLSRFAAIALVLAVLSVLVAEPRSLPTGIRVVDMLKPQPAAAQELRRLQDVGQRVYELVPGLPVENQYIDRSTGESDPANTLVTRLIRYHVYTKGRPPTYRLDWKLTLADYLGANERILPSTYPGGDTLRTNPLEGDIAAINGLTRSERDALVQTLVDIFNPGASTGQTGTSSPTPQPSVTPSPAARPTAPLPSQPRPGDAQLLLP